MEWKADYIKMLGCVDTAELQIEKAQQLKISHLPDFLYKYYSATEFALSNLETDTVWLNKPSEYNDPFEFTEFLDIEKLTALYNSQMKDELIDTMTEKHPVPEEIVNRAKVSHFPMRIIAEYQFKKYENRSDEFIKEMIEACEKALEQMILNRHLDKIKLMQDKMKVCSFCESPTQLLMWSHYAKDHKGFCVEYDITKWHPADIRKRFLYPVIYQENLYDSTDHLINNISNKNFNNLYPIISGSTKSMDWEYEKEWRFIFNIGDSFEKQNYQMDCQSRVFLGSRMPQEFKDKILSICQTKKINVYVAIPSEKKYEVRFEIIAQNAS